MNQNHLSSSTNTTTSPQTLAPNNNPNNNNHIHGVAQTCATPVPDTVSRYHTHAVGPNQCCFVVTQQISGVWPVVRRFDNPQEYKHFVKSCHVVNGDGSVGDGWIFSKSSTPLLLFKWPIQSTDAEEPAAGKDEDTGALVALIVKLEEVAVTSGEEDEDTVLDL